MGDNAIKNHLVAALGEFVGTFLFLFFAFAGTQTANLSTTTPTTDSKTGPNIDQLNYICLIFGFSLAVNVWVFFRVSGGLFNPAVTLSLCLTGVVPPLRSIFIFVSQLAGAISAAGIVRLIIPSDEIFFAVKLAPGMSVVQGLFLEMFLTAELVFTILMLAAEKTKATFVAPVGIGLSLFVGELVGIHWTGGALNPARAFGPAVILSSFDTYHWIYWVGPILGALLASAFYALIKYLNYEEVNGDQDKPEDEEYILDMARKHQRQKSESEYHRRTMSGGHQRQMSAGRSSIGKEIKDFGTRDFGKTDFGTRDLKTRDTGIRESRSLEMRGPWIPPNYGRYSAMPPSSHRNGEAAWHYREFLRHRDGA